MISIHSSGQKVWTLSGYDIMKHVSLSNFSLPANVKKISAALYEDSEKMLLFVGKTYYRYVRVCCYLEKIK